MSIAAVTKAVRDAIQTEFEVGPESCEVGFDGQPKPACGEKYWAVHPLSWQGLPDEDWALGEEYQVGVTLTFRMGVAPKDRWGLAVWLADNGMEDFVRRTITLIHHSQTIRVAAGVYITGGASGKILTPLQLLRIENPKPQGPQWFSAEPVDLTQQKYTVADCGVSQTMVFGRCQRVQSIPDMD